MALDNDIELREFIRKAALLNAVSHDGKAQAGALVGKILGEKAELRSRVKELSGVINAVVGEVNSLSLAEQKTIVEKNWPETQKKEKAEEKHSATSAKRGQVQADSYAIFSEPRLRFALGFSPSHPCLATSTLRMYNGKFILRFEDTDPKIKKPSLKFYDSIRQDLKWLGCKVDEEYIQSDRLPIYYQYTEKLVATATLTFVNAPLKCSTT